MTTIRVAHRERFTVVDRRTVNDERLSFRARGILVWLLDKPNGWRVDSDEIAAAAKEGRAAVRAALNELAQVGYIARHKQQDGRGRWSTWTDVHERPSEVASEELPLEVPTEDRKPDSGSPDAGAPVAVSKTVPMTVNEDCSSTSSTSSTARADAAFEGWWLKYPKKVSGKGEARTRWRKMTKADQAAATAGLERHVVWWAEHATETRYIPSGAVWLNQRRWEDDAPRNGGAFVQNDGRRTAPGMAILREMRARRLANEADGISDDVITATATELIRERRLLP